MVATVLPGDVLVVHDPHSVPAWWIRFGEWVAGKPANWNHVLIAHHIDAADTYWGIEGRPGDGVGWRDMASYLTDPRTLTNAAQPKTADQRGLIKDAAEALLPAPGHAARYDWPAIVVDGLEMVDPLYRMRDKWGPGVPTQVVCSSMADWVYEHCGLATPAADRFCTPADWAAFIQRKGWQ